MNPIPFKGKGAMIWKIRECTSPGSSIEKGIEEVINLAAASKLQWLALKVCNGYYRAWEGSEPKQNYHYLPGLVRGLRNVGIESVGWGYVYGRGLRFPFNVISGREAEAAVAAIKAYNLRSFMIDAEGEYMRILPGGFKYAAELYMNGIRAHLPDVAVGLCSYRNPTQQGGRFPWAEFLRGCDFHAPQVYWFGEDNESAGGNALLRSMWYLQNLADLPVVPIAPIAPSPKGWIPKPNQLTDFLITARMNFIPAVGYYSLDAAIKYNLDNLRAEWDEYQFNGSSPQGMHYAQLTDSQLESLQIYSMMHPTTQLINDAGMLLVKPWEGS